MTTYINHMKFFSPSDYPPPPDNIHTLTMRLDQAYLNLTRMYSNRAYSASACARVLIELTKIYQQGLELIGKDAPLAKISTVLGEFDHYKVPKELEAMFSNPCVIQFPKLSVKRKKKQ